MAIQPIKLDHAFDQVHAFWSPHIVGHLNGQMIKIAKVKGDFIWHSHADEDEAFLVVKGLLHIELKDKTIHLQPGELVVIPKGIPHRPYAEEETHILLFEPAQTINTGAERHELTRDQLPDLSA
ncbi:MAG: cupin domain-containing protein [Saprospiraceae bacterium]|nr:cupin domain-containing protein [Saprospiraceae bacterium]